MTISAVLNAYIDVNIVLMLASGVWLITRALLNRSALRGAFSSQLQALYGVISAVVMAPVVIILYELATARGLFGSGYALSVPDYTLAQFLNGRFEMAPSTFETLWMSRTFFVQDVTSLGSSTGVFVAAALCLGILFYALRLFRNVLRVHLLIGHSYLWRRIHGVEIRLTDRIAIPFSTKSLRRRYIVLPSTLLSEADDMRIAIAHELQHMRQHDLGWEIVLEAMRPLFFWNPGFLYLKREVEELRELACDQQVLLRRRFEVKEYCDCLLRVCRDALRPMEKRQILVRGVALISTPGNRRTAKILKNRVVSMLSHSRSFPGKWVSGALAVTLLAVISLGTVATQSKDDWSQDRLMLSAIVNLERLDQRNQGSLN